MTKSKARKLMYAAILIVVAAVSAWIGAYIDGDETTNPDTEAVVISISDLVGAIGDVSDATETNVIEIVE